MRWSGCLSYLLKVTRGASQCFPHSFSSQEECTKHKAYNRMFSLKLTALPDTEEGLLTQQIRGSYQHTGLSGRCCLEITLSHTHRVSTVNSVGQGDHILTLTQDEHKKRDHFNSFLQATATHYYIYYVLEK